MSPTTRELYYRKEERVRREQRYYTPDLRGPRCWVCKGWTDPKVSAATGEALHPTCAEPQLMARAKAMTRRASEAPAPDTTEGADA